MQVLGMGLDWKGKRLFQPVEESAFITALRNGLEANSQRVGTAAIAGTRATQYRGEQARAITDRGDPKIAGWTFLLSDKDPNKDAIVAALRPLAEARGMKDSAKPLVFTDGGPDSWQGWMVDRFMGLDPAGEQVPGYVLIVGGPDLVPFGFQALLDQAASVGRVDFATTEDLATYAAKLVRLEAAPEPAVSREALFFATDGGPEDPTFFSRKYMADPLSTYVRDTHKLGIKTIFGDDATKANLLAALKQSKAGLVYTASHGLGATSESQAVQAKYNGAICCKVDGPLTLDGLLSADDIPMADAFLEGAVFFQFACFGYGTPALSEYAHWLPETYGKAQRNTDRDFVAALPRRLLSHPRGPIAFIGHLDTAWLHGFADASEPHTLDRWHSRIAPFKKAVDQLLGVQPSGLAMEGLNERYSICNAVLTNTANRVQQGTMNWTDETMRGFLDTWITRGDAQNYMVLGDPAASLRLPA